LNTAGHLSFHVEITNLEKTPEFFELANGYYSDRKDLRGYHELIAEISELKNDTSLSNSIFYTVYSDEMLCGCAWAYLADNIIKIPLFVVQDEFREIGVGDYLFNSILNTDFFEDATGFESHVLPGDRQAKNFFEQHAGKTRKLIVQGLIADAKTEQ
jgi:hypothetical protein